MFNLDVTPKNNDIENTYSNISKDDWLKDHSVCKGKHNLVENGGRYPTCEAMGTTEYHCTNTGCNYIERIYTDPPKGHNYDYTNGEIIQSQDCTHPEITRYRCTRCKDPKDVEAKPSLGGHKWKAGDITKEPTCTVNGEQQYTCTVCNQTKTEPVKATGHDWQINKILSAATCTSNGIARYICKTCGYGENHTITATGHKPEIRNKKEATCSSTGYTGDTYCSVCNKKLSSGETIAKKEHTWVKQDNIPATCEKGGMEVEKCSVCGETKETQISDPLGHDYGEWKVTKEPTCTKYGTKKRICKRCNEYEIDVIDPTGHQHTKIIDQKKATCEEKGYSGDLYCEDCRLIIQLGHDIASTGHTWDDGEITKEPTQTATGIKTYTCKTCHKTRTETIPMLKGHHWDDGTVIKEPTCTESGEKIYHCTDEDCNESYTETIKATGHQHTKLIRKKEAACEEEGYSGDTYCEDCKQIIKAGKIISPTGHINTEIRNKRTATCESEGYTGDTYCITCNKKLKDGQTIPKTDHNWTIKEIEPSEGYKLNPEVYDVGAEPELYELEYNEVAVDANEDVLKGRVALIKHTDDGSTQIETPEEGAEFQMFLRSAGSYEAAKETERDILICDEFGYAESKDVPYGWYTIHQTKGWDGREFIKDFDVYISEDGAVYRFLINNANFESRVMVVKKDAETGNTVPLAGHGYKLYDPQGNPITMTITYPEVVELDTFYTDSGDYLITPESPPYGEGYSLVEVQTVEPYVLDSTPVYFDITPEDAEDHNGVTVVVVEKPNMPQKGTISLYKDGEVFSSVTTASGGDGPLLYQPVYDKTGLAGGVYDVVATEDVISGGVLRYHKGDTVSTLTTGPDGWATSEPLYLSTYQIYERKAPYGMVLNPEPVRLPLH